MDYEKASSIINSAKVFSVGLCSCRHEKLHLKQKKCNAPLELCTSFDTSAKFLISHNFAKKVSKTEVLENLAQAKEFGLVLNADNVQNKVSFLCLCCGCCCNLFLGIRKFGYENAIVTANVIAEIDEKKCDGCAKCAKACPINAIEMTSDKNLTTAQKKQPRINTSLCLGCGLCSLKCTTNSLKLRKRKQRVIHPETTFERIILQTLERGNLQNFIFDNPGRLSHRFMRLMVGAFLKLPPVKKSLMSEELRSTFLRTIKNIKSPQRKK